MSVKKRIAITGASGKIGRVTVERLEKAGYDLFLIDKKDPLTDAHPAMIADLEDFGATIDALSSVGEDVYSRPEQAAFDAVVHLASIPHPRMIPDSDEFRNNMLSTFNVFEASRRLGIKNIVWSSSEVPTGVPYDQWNAPYVPVDENYPARGLSIYALTKVLGEEMARQFCLNNADMRITCLRLSNVMAPEEYAQFESWQDDSTVRLWNMWTYVDVRDVAHAIEKALEYEVRGKDEFFITSDITCMRTPTQELLDRYYPDVEQRKKFVGNESVLSSEKAMRVLGYRPAYRWTDSDKCNWYLTLLPACRRSVNSFQLENRMSGKKLALITGASNGIGLALAEEFAANEYDLAIVARDEKKLSVAREHLQKHFSVNVHAFSADLSEYDQITDLQARMDKAGLNLSALVINAGQGLGGAFNGGTDLEKELRLIRLNVDAVVHLSKIFIPRLVEKGNGHVLITSSLSGSAPIPFEAVYAASKAFVNSFFYAVRNELMGSGLSMTLLMPGATETNFFKNAGQSSTTVGSMKKDDPKEVARRAWYALMTGHEFVYGSEYAEYEGEVMNRMMSESHKAQRHRIISEPNSAMKK